MSDQDKKGEGLPRQQETEKSVSPFYGWRGVRTGLKGLPKGTKIKKVLDLSGETVVEVTL